MFLLKNHFTIWSALFLLTLLILSSTAYAIQVPGPLVNTEWLAKNLDQAVVLDVRANKASFEKKVRGAQAVNPCGVGSKKKVPVISYGHISGSVLVPLKNINESRKINGVKLKAFVLNKAAFEKLMQNSGVSNDSAVVITSRGQSFMDAYFATRLYWMMKYYSHDNVAILNGGTKKWIEDGHKIKYGKSRPKRSKYQAGEPRSELIATADEVANIVNKDKIQLVDNRGLAGYLGLTHHRKFTKPDRKGHIPGAKFWPITTLLDSKGTPIFYSSEDIRKVAEIMGVDVDKPTITYCWSGGFGSTSWFVMHELLGNKNTRLYDGSMHEWVQDPKHELVTMKME